MSPSPSVWSGVIKPGSRFTTSPNRLSKYSRMRMCLKQPMLRQSYALAEMFSLKHNGESERLELSPEFIDNRSRKPVKFSFKTIPGWRMNHKGLCPFQSPAGGNTGHPECLISSERHTDWHRIQLAYKNLRIFNRLVSYTFQLEDCNSASIFGLGNLWSTINPCTEFSFLPLDIHIHIYVCIYT